MTLLQSPTLTRYYIETPSKDESSITVQGKDPIMSLIQGLLLGTFIGAIWAVRYLLAYAHFQRSEARYYNDLLQYTLNNPPPLYPREEEYVPVSSQDLDQRMETINASLRLQLGDYIGSHPRLLKPLYQLSPRYKAAQDYYKALEKESHNHPGTWR